jgi:membrane fusion protein, multidrug efflux system
MAPWGEFMRIRFTRQRIIAMLAVLVVLGGLAAAVAMRIMKQTADSAKKDKAPVALEFAQADLAYLESKPLSRWLPVSGALQPVNQATVKAKIAGEVLQVTVREGQAVKAGQLLVRLDTVDLDTRLVERIGALESAKAQLALAEKTRAMNTKLLNEKFISQNAYDGSESTFNVAQGAVKSAEAQVRLAQSAIRDAAVVAPLSGIVAKRHVQPGEKVPFDTALVTVVDLTELEMAALVPTSDVPELRIGMPVDLSVDGFGERRFSGRIERINPAIEPGTRAINVYVGLANREATLRSGMFATGRIALAQSQPMPTLPLTAVRTEAGQSYVWTIDNGKLVRRIVALGRRDDEAGRVEVKTMLPPNVPVLAARFDNLKEGAKAIVKGPSSSSNAGSQPVPSLKPAG